MKLDPDLREFIELLNAREVHYLIVGAIALSFHGRPRYTGDIDFFVEPSAENAALLTRILDDFGFANIGVNQEDFTAADQVVQLGVEPHRMDLMTSISGVAFSEAEKSDREFYRQLSGQERLEILLQLSKHEPERRLERVYRVIKLPRR